MGFENSKPKNIWTKIKEIKSDNDIILYGYSFLGEIIEKVLKVNNLSIRYIWDKKAKSKGKQLTLPYESGKKEDLVIICIGNSYIRETVMNSLLEEGYNNILSGEIYKELIRESLDFYEQNNQTYPTEKVLIENNLEKLNKAVQYAIDSNYQVWDRQYFWREKSRIAKNLIFFGYIGNERAEKFYMNYCKNNGLRNLKAVCNFDCSYWGQKTLGVEYINPQKLLEVDDVFVIVIDSQNGLIKEFLHTNHIPWCSITDLELNVFDHKFPSIWFDDEKDNILKAYGLLEDETSKEIYTETICNRIAPHLAKKEYFELRSPEREYFDHKIFDIGNHETLVDVGAYIGDTILSFLEVVHGEFNEIFAFEMDEDNFLQMQKNIRLNGFDNLHIHLYRKGVYDKNERVNYSSNAGGSVLDLGHESNKYVELVKLDDFLKNNKVSIIKMDIEGSEMGAINGCKNIISEQKPKMAISVYHHLYDIWKIPLYLSALNPSYRFKIRHHTGTVWDTDLYAY